MVGDGKMLCGGMLCGSIVLWLGGNKMLWWYAVRQYSAMVGW